MSDPAPGIEGKQSCKIRDPCQIQGYRTRAILMEIGTYAGNVNRKWERQVGRAHAGGVGDGGAVVIGGTCDSRDLSGLESGSCVHRGDGDGELDEDGRGEVHVVSKT